MSFYGSLFDATVANDQETKMIIFKSKEDIKTFIEKDLKCTVEEYINSNNYTLERIIYVFEILIIRNMRENEEHITIEMAEKINAGISDSNDLTALRMSPPWQEFIKYITDIYNKSHNESR